MLDRYNQGSSTEEESAIIEQWFEGINQHHSMLVDEHYLQQQLDDVRQHVQERIQPPVRRSRIGRIYSLAAAAVLLVAAGIFGIRYFITQQQPSIPGMAVKSGNGKTNRIIRDGFVEVSTNKGATERIVLADGSTVVVNASSKIKYPVDFGGNSRDIYLLEGEAHFTVAQNGGGSFVVHTGELNTTALATVFNIRAYAYEQKIKVSLLEGKVKVDHVKEGQSQPPIILLPSEQLDFDLHSLVLEKVNFSKPEEIAGWKQGYLVFKDASYQQVIKEIENRYGVTIINQSDKTQWEYTGFFKDESLQDIIETICLTKGLSYTIDQDSIYLKNKTN